MDPLPDPVLAYEARSLYVHPTDLESGAFMTWTTTPPTEPGWYWMASGPNVFGWIGHYFKTNEGVVRMSNMDNTKSFARLAAKGNFHWLGPLPVPEPPAVDEMAK